MSDEEVEKAYGASKERVLEEVEAELGRLERVRELVEKHGGGASLTVNVDGATVRASDLITYLVWRHHPAEVNRVIMAETNAVLSRWGAMDWLRQAIPVIIVAAIAVIGVLAAVHMLAGPSPSASSPTHVVIGR